MIIIRLNLIGKYLTNTILCTFVIDNLFYKSIYSDLDYLQQILNLSHNQRYFLFIFLLGNTLFAVNFLISKLKIEKYFLFIIPLTNFFVTFSYLFLIRMNNISILFVFILTYTSTIISIENYHQLRYFSSLVLFNFSALLIALAILQLI